MDALPNVDGAAAVGARRGLRAAQPVGLWSPPARVQATSDELDVTVVVPTRNEAGNVNELLRRLDAALGSLRAEVLFVDDSDDETPAVILAAAERSSRNIRLLHREPGRREGRLGGAVVAGFQLARAPWAAVIDGDLQHPPEAIPSLLLAGRAQDVDLVYGSRYVEDGDAAGLGGPTRRWVSSLSTVLAKALFPRKLSAVSDPMSGFFAIRLAALDSAALRPAGYKVLLEILAQARLRRTAAVPFSFQPRYSGRSKASLAEGIRFLTQLLALRLGMSVGRLSQLTQLLTVGVIGVGVNTVIMWALIASWSHLPYLMAFVLAINVTLVAIFWLLTKYGFRQTPNGSYWEGIPRFWFINVTLLPFQLGSLVVLVGGAAMKPLMANVVVVCMVFGLWFMLTSTWVFSGKATAGGPVIWALDVLRGLGLRTVSRRSYLFRLVLLIAATLVAVPASAVQSWAVLQGGGIAAAELVVVVVAALVMVALRTSPSAGDPDVHDRQLDVIMAVPILAAAVWSSLGWSAELAPGAPWSTRDAVTACLFLAGSSLLLIGTRLTARLRWALCLPLLGLPAVTDRPLLLGALLTAVVVAITTTVAVRLYRRRRTTQGGHLVAPARHQRLPSWRFGVAVVVAVAGLLAFITIGNASAPAPASTPAAQLAP